MDIIKLDYGEVPDSILDIIMQWESDRAPYACAVMEFGKRGDYVYLGRLSGELAAITLVTPGQPNILQFLATKRPGHGKIFLGYICNDDPLALRATNESRGFYDKCGFSHVGNGNYIRN